MFHELVTHARRDFPDVEWDVFLPRGYEWVPTEGVSPIPVDVDSGHLPSRLAADHFSVPWKAHRRGAKALVTVGFLPTLQVVPSAVHILSLHHLDRDNGTGGLRARYRRHATNSALEKADLVITNSRTAAQELIALHPSVAPRLLVSHEGLQHEEFHPRAARDEEERLARELKLAPGYVLWVSNFYPYKQLDLALAAYAGLSANERAAHPLVLAGGKWQDGVEAMVERLGIARDVHFLGWTPGELIAPLYRHAALHLMSSRAETFGRSVLESMACGTPCLVNDIPIMREVTDGAAFFVNFGDTGAATETLRVALTDGTVREEIRRHGLIRAQDFSMKKLAFERMTAILDRFGPKNR